MNKIFSLSLLALLTSCSFFIEKLDTKLVDEKDYRDNMPDAPTFCPVEEKISFQLVGTNPFAQTVYNDFKKEAPRDFLDHFAIWSLAQLSIRPDQSSPTSRLQVLIHHSGKSQYFDFFSETQEDQYPYLYGIEWILKKFGKTTTLETYAKIVEDHFSGKILVDKDLEAFLKKNKESIKGNPELANHFFRGTEVLKENEKIPFLNYLELIRTYRKVQKQNKPVINTSLTAFSTALGQEGKCNYDFNLYDNSIFLIDKSVPSTNLFGLSDEKNGFLAATSQRMDQLTSINGQPLFKGSSKVRSSAVCVIEDGEKKIWTVSNNSRDPGQHLFHLVRYGLAKTQNTQEVDKLIRHSRHLFLSDPVRLIIESHRSRPDQIENLLKLNLPIYNAEKLGNIWAYAFFKSQNRFIIDERNPGAFKCIP